MRKILYKNPEPIYLRKKIEDFVDRKLRFVDRRGQKWTGVNWYSIFIVDLKRFLVCEKVVPQFDCGTEFPITTGVNYAKPRFDLVKFHVLDKIIGIVSTKFVHEI